MQSKQTLVLSIIGLIVLTFIVYYIFSYFTSSRSENVTGTKKFTGNKLEYGESHKVADPETPIPLKYESLNKDINNKNVEYTFKYDEINETGKLPMKRISVEVDQENKINIDFIGDVEELVNDLVKFFEQSNKKELEDREDIFYSLSNSDDKFKNSANQNDVNFITNNKKEKSKKDIMKEEMRKRNLKLKKEYYKKRRDAMKNRNK